MVTTTNSVKISEITVDATDPNKTGWGADLAAQPYFAIATGTDADETFALSDLSAETRARMDERGRGVTVNLGAGNDTIGGSGYGDALSGGTGVNHVDGGADLGTNPWGGQAVDVLDVYVADAAAAAAVGVVSLTASAAGEDGAAYAAGYRFKVTNGAVETSYVKGVEQINVWSGTERTYAKSINLATVVHEAGGTNLDQYMHLAWATGSAYNDTFDASVDTSAATQAAMASRGRGIWVDGGAGDDTLRGSDYGDHLIGGAGTNYIDGGANNGVTSWGAKAEDVLQVTVSSQAIAQATTVTALTGTLAGADAAAQAQGYTHKVVAGDEIDYIRGVERVVVQVFDGANWSFGRDIALTVRVQEADLAKSGTATQGHVAWVHGTGSGDTINAAGGAGLLSTTLEAHMAGSKQGVWIDGGDGDDTIVGSANADAIRNGAGSSHIDGGAHAGPSGRLNKDVFEIGVKTQAELDAINVAKSDDPDYEWVVTYGTGSTQKDYLKNVEAISAYSETGTGKWMSLVLDVNEVGSDSANHMHFAWAHGTERDESFAVEANVSQATRDKMAAAGRGVWIDMGAGNDVVQGSAYGDDIYAGAGDNLVDGGANNGTRPWGGNNEDVLRVVVASAAEAAALQVVTLSAGAGSSTDQAQFGAGYTHKVVRQDGVDYIRNIERISVEVDSGTARTHARDIALAVKVQEADLKDANIGNFYHVGWVNGTGGADTIDAGAGTPLLTSALRTQMDTGKQGVWIDGGAGDDTITGSAYGDSIRNGAGNAKVDGGANLSKSGTGRDIFEVAVASEADLAAITVSASDDPDYTHMVTYGPGSTQKDYLKNVEAISAYVEGGGHGRWIALAVDVHGVPAKDASEKYQQLAFVTGTEWNDTFAASSGIGADTLGLMAQYKRGVYVNGGAGDDVITTSGYADYVVAGAGNDRIDGGASLTGTEDVLQLVVKTAADAAAVSVAQLAAQGSSADVAAFNAGYTHKVVQAGGEVDYIKNIERINVQVSDGVKWTHGRDILLQTSVHEASLTDPNLNNFGHVAWIRGTDTTDTINGAALVSIDMQAQMAKAKQGLWIDGGKGDDTITGSAYADVFLNGAGNAKVDGGAHDARAGWYGGDIFEIHVASVAERDAIKVVPSDHADYTWMVTYGAGSTQKDYLRNIESVIITIDGGGDGKSIPLGMSVGEIGDGMNLAEQMHFAWMNGTEHADTFNAATDVSAATRGLMDKYQRGVWVDAKEGNDKITGSAYGDDIDAGAGVNYVDGGANGGKAPWGGAARDNLRIVVSSQAEADAVKSAALSGAAGTSEDIAAFKLGYTHKVTTADGSRTDYIKNIESVEILVRLAEDKWEFGRMINLAVRADEINLADPKQAEWHNVATIQGTDSGDTIHLGAGTPLLSDAIQADMLVSKRGVYVNGGDGNDIITGTAYADGFSNGAGNAKIDGGAHDSAQPYGARDQFDIEVASKAEMDAIAVTKSDDPSYQWMVTYGPGSTQKDYLKNIESVNIHGPDLHRHIGLAVTVHQNGAEADVAKMWHVVSVSGTEQADTFAALDVPANLQTLMKTHQRGMYMNMGAGNDTVTGSGYGDNIDAGLGVNYIDGGANGGVDLNGSAGRDAVVFQVASKAEMEGAKVVVLDGSGSDADMAAFAKGYTHKFADAAGTRVDYLKNIEKLELFVEETPGSRLGRHIDLAPRAEMSTDAKSHHAGWVYGTAGNELIDASAGSSLLSSALQASIAESARGLHIEGKGGSDTIIGTAYSDFIRASSGVNHIDGGANAGVTGWGEPGRDTYEIRVDSQAEYDTLTLEKLVAGAGSSADAAAFANGYTHKTVHTAPGRADYLKNIEQVSVVFRQSPEMQVGRSIDTMVNTRVHDVKSIHAATLVGTADWDVLDGSSTSKLLSAAIHDDMTSTKRGLYIDGGDGDDVITGSAYADSIRNGAGNAHVDGGANPANTHMQVDRFEIQLATKAEADAVQVVASDDTAYQWMVTYGPGSIQKDYLKNIEAVSISAGTSHRYIALAVEVHDSSSSPEAGNYSFLAHVNGTPMADTFVAATDLSPAIRAAMDIYGRGVSMNMHGGGDTVVGTAYGDIIEVGDGTNFIDGGANGGTTTHGAMPMDTLSMTAGSKADLDSLAGTTLSASSVGADLAAFQEGYTIKVSLGDAVNYVRNIESAQARYWNDVNGNGMQDMDETTFNHLQLSATTYESLENTAKPGYLTNGMPIADARTLAHVEGTSFDDTVSADAILSTATKALLDQYDMGVYFGLGVGTDRAIGTDFGDLFNVREGVKYLDGGAQGGEYLDRVDIRLADGNIAAEAVLEELSGESTARDGAAFAEGYTHRISAGDNTYYLRGVEEVHVLGVDGTSGPYENGVWFVM